MPPRTLILETSGRVGQVAVACGDVLLGVRRLEEARRHARDLVPATRDLLAQAGFNDRELDAVIVSRGPGSYTGLRVGIMSAKALAYATGCAVVAIDTFAAIAHQAPADVHVLDVIADAQQDRVYVQRFRREGAGFQPQTALAVRPLAEWLAALTSDVWISGPGVREEDERFRNLSLVDATVREPGPRSLLELGLARLARGEKDDLWKLEPLYLRPSAAEEQWKGK